MLLVGVLNLLLVHAEYGLKRRTVLQPVPGYRTVLTFVIALVLVPDSPGLFLFTIIFCYR